MTVTKKDQVIHPEILTDAVRAGLAGMTVFEGTRVAVVKANLANGAGIVGTEVKVPYFADLGEFEDLSNDGDALTPALLETSEETATVGHSGKAFEITRWAQGGVGDPYAEAARQIVDGAKRLFQRKLVAKAGDTTNWSHMVIDDYSAGSPAYLDYDRIVRGKLLFADEANDSEMTLFIASKVKGDLLMQKDSTGRPLMTEATAGAPGRYCGIPYVVSDLLAPSGLSSVTSDGTTPPTVTVSGAAIAGSMNFRIEITTGGSRGTAIFRWSNNAGVDWHSGVTTAASVVLGTTGVTVAFASGTYATDNVYTFAPGGAYKSLICQPGALALWLDAMGTTVEVDRDILANTQIGALHTYYAAHRYKRLPGRTRGGVAIVRHNAGRS